MKNDLDNQHDLRTFNLIATLQSIINTNEENDSNVILAKQIIKNLKDLDNISIYDLADESFVSRSSLQRFIKNIGFDSFSNLKAKIPEVLNHSQRFARYTAKDDFIGDFHKQFDEMCESIEKLAGSKHMDYFVDLIHNSKRVVFCFADNSTNAPFAFQEAMLGRGKIIRCITNSTRSMELLETLDEFDMLVTLSTTGNYALATINDIKKVRAFKVLFTLNYLSSFKNVYDRIIYLSEAEESFDFIRDGLRDVYTEYSLNYFFDLLLYKYNQKYGSQ